MNRFSQIGASSAWALLALLFVAVDVAARPVRAVPTPPPADIEARRADLDDLHARIKALKNDISTSEASRSEVEDELSTAETAISAAQRRLREISSEREAVEAERWRLSEERDAAKGELVAQRKALGETLYRYYVFGRRAGARHLLGGDDPNQMARDAYYLERMAVARRAEIDKARQTLARHTRLIRAVSREQVRIEQLEKEQAQAHDNLLAEQQKRAQVLAQIQDRLKAQRREVATLQQNEKRLARLIDGLTKLPPPKPRIARIPSKTPAGRPVPRIRADASAPVEPVTGHAEVVVAPDSPSDLAFGQLRGKLHWPIRGELTGRFGAPKADGVTQWKGVFIRAANGEVKAVAPGRVVYADWLRGFGNLLIVDHGDGYMSIYGNNEALYKAPGAEVKTGDTIASVGASGGAPDSGLYFEIRRHGQPLDPAKWVAGR